MNILTVDLKCHSKKDEQHDFLIKGDVQANTINLCIETMTKFLTIISYTTLFLLLLNGCNKPANNSANNNDLTVTGQCKPVDNKCEILGEGIKLNLKFKATPSYQRLLPVTLESFDSKLELVSISMIIGGKEMPAVEMKSIGDKQWEAHLMTFAKITKDNIKIRLSVSHNSKLHSAEYPIQY